MENIVFEVTDIESATWSNQIELMNLISGDVTISAGGRSIVYDDVSVIDFSIQLASSFMTYLTSGQDRISFRSPDYYDSFIIEVQSDNSAYCSVILNGEIVSNQESFIEIVSTMRSFMHQVRSLIEANYGDIEHLWEFLIVSVF